MPTQPLDVALAFFASWKKAPSSRAPLQAYFTAETVWENVGVSRTVGIDEAMKLMDAFSEQMPMEHMSAEVLAAAATGNQVLTERIDYIHDKDGNVLHSIRLMGILEIRDGKIAAWRDYADPAVLAAQQ